MKNLAQILEKKMFAHLRVVRINLLIQPCSQSYAAPSWPNKMTRILFLKDKPELSYVLTKPSFIFSNLTPYQLALVSILKFISASFLQVCHTPANQPITPPRRQALSLASCY